MKLKADTVAFIVANDILKQHVEAILKDSIASGDVIVVKMDVSNLEMEGRALVDSGVGAIVARGGTYEDLKKVITSIPVIRIEVAASDILFSLARAKDKYREIYLILHKSIVFDFETWKDLLDIELIVKRYTGIRELKKLLDAIDGGPETVVVGGGACADFSKEKKLNTIEILPRTDTNIIAYENAKNMILQMKRERSQIKQLESIMYSVGDGVIIIDHKGNILHFNRKCEELLSVEKAKAIGKNIHSVMDCAAFEKYLYERPFSPKHGIITVDGRKISLRIDLFQVYQDEEQFILTLSEVARIQELEQNIRRKLSQKGLVAKYCFDDILTKNQTVKDIIEKAKRITDIEGAVLIFGESGTGKELFAQSIHNGSRRRNGPFVAVNCAALSESLLESELFGYVSGAFTGAKKEGKAGLFELAHGGTIFLDEINSMPLSVQTKVLRVIEQKEVMRIGADYVIPLDVRIIAATNGRIRDAVKEKTFRQDLYFRLNTFEIRIPPLRERKEDIVFLFKYYLGAYAKVRPEELRLEPAFEELLQSHDWLGNVRELKSTALRYFTFEGDNGNKDILDVEREETIQERSIIDSDLRIDLKQLSKTVEGLVIRELLERGVPKQEIARMLGISRQALFQKIQKMQ